MDSAEFGIVPNAGEGCGPATLTLRSAVAVAPDGTEVALGDVALANADFGRWPPFECHM